MAPPSIKGVAIKSLVADVKALIDDGEISQSELRDHLTEDDMEIVDAPVLDSGWYPIDSYRRMTELVRDHLGGADPEGYLMGRGAAVAERLVSLGVYQQVDFIQRAGRAANIEVAVANLRLTASLWNSFFNFGKWDAREDANGVGYYMEVRDSREMPEVGWYAVHGCMTGLSRATGNPNVRVVREHTRDGRVLFRFGVPATD